MNTQKSEEKVTKLQNELDLYQGSQVSVFRYQRTHPVLQLLVIQVGSRSELLISLIEPIKIKASFRWDNCLLKLSYLSGIFYLEDERNDTVFSTEDIEIEKIKRL